MSPAISSRSRASRPRRSTHALLVGVLTMVGLLLAGGATAQAFVPTDSASGSGSFTQAFPTDFTFSATSGPSGENPSGTATVTAHLPGGDVLYTGPVRCLTVTGNRATLFFDPVAPSTSTASTVEVDVTDAPSGGEPDRATYITSQPANTACPPEAYYGYFDLTSGSLTVSDAMPIVDGDGDGVADSTDNCPTVAGDTDAGGCPTVDSHGATKAGAPVYTSAPLTNGQSYTVTVRGTGSAFAKALMAPDGQRTRGWAICGTPEASNAFASPAIDDARAGQDAEFLYAFPQKGTKCSASNTAALPKRQSALRFNTGSGFAAPTATNAGGGLRGDHTYTYTVTGTGAPLKVKFQDTNYLDNSGRFSIDIEAAGDVAVAR